MLIIPLLFLTGLNLIETITTDKRRYFEKIVKIRVKANEPTQYSYRCGACDFKIHSGKEMLAEPRFCPHCGIPFKRVRYTVREENGFEQTILRKPYHELFP